MTARPASAPVTSARSPAKVFVPGAARTGAEVELKVGVACGRGGNGFDGFEAERGAAEVGVDHDAGGVNHGPGPAAQTLGSAGEDCVHDGIQVRDRDAVAYGISGDCQFVADELDDQVPGYLIAQVLDGRF